MKKLYNDHHRNTKDHKMITHTYAQKLYAKKKPDNLEEMDKF